MGNIYKRGKIWYIDITVKGRRIRKKVGSSKKIAELALKDAEVKAAREEFGFSQNDISIEKFFQLFLEYSSANHRNNTTARYRAVMDHFSEFLEQYPDKTFVSEVDAELIERYKIFRKGSPVTANGQSVDSCIKNGGSPRKGARTHTINFELDTLRLFFNLAIKWGYLKENPTKWTKRLKVDDAKPPRFLTKSECDLLLKSCSDKLYPIFFALLNTGLRKSELENLQWDDLDFDRRKMKIQFKKNWQPKSGEREIPMNENLYTLLKRIFNESPNQSKSDYVFNIITAGHSRNWIRTQLIKIAEQAGVDNLTKLHTLRHTFASHLVMAGVDLPTVKKLMGHSDIQTTMIYAHLAPDHLSNAVDKLPFG